MKIIVAIDSFKGSLNSMEAARAVENGIKKAGKNVELKIYPLADGGEGTCKILTKYLNGEFKLVRVAGALGTRLDTTYGKVGDTAIIESASAAGLEIVPKNLRNPIRTTTLGVGEMIVNALDEGCKNFIIGLGGTATNDCGLGMLTALGFKFNTGIFGRDLMRVKKIELTDKFSDCKFKIACDVNNPLTGENGCSVVYGSQKGADEATIQKMDGWIKDFAALTAETLQIENISVPGDGAAGGLGFAFRTFLKGELVPGVNLVLETMKIADELKDADILITGEGMIDSQTSQGKAPMGVAKLAKSINAKIKVVAIGGGVKDISAISEIDAAFSILREPTDLITAMQKSTTEKNLSVTAEQIIRLIA